MKDLIDVTPEGFLREGTVVYVKEQGFGMSHFRQRTIAIVTATRTLTQGVKNYGLIVKKPSDGSDYDTTPWRGSAWYPEDGLEVITDEYLIEEIRRDFNSNYERRY
jgi:hypothetical protein